MSDQYLLSITIISLLGMFIWSKFRYDALAAGALGYTHNSRSNTS